MIGAWLGASVCTSVSTTLGRELRQIAAGTVSNSTRPRRKHDSDRIIASQFLESRQDFPNRIAAQSVPFLRPVDGNFRHRTALFQKQVFSLCLHEQILSSRIKQF